MPDVCQVRTPAHVGVRCPATSFVVLSFFLRLACATGTFGRRPPAEARCQMSVTHGTAVSDARPTRLSFWRFTCAAGFFDPRTSCGPILDLPKDCGFGLSISSYSGIPASSSACLRSASGAQRREGKHHRFSVSGMSLSSFFLLLLFLCPSSSSSRPSALTSFSLVESRSHQSGSRQISSCSESGQSWMLLRDSAIVEFGRSQRGLIAAGILANGVACCVVTCI